MHVSVCVQSCAYVMLHAHMHCHGSGTLSSLNPSHGPLMLNLMGSLAPGPASECTPSPDVGAGPFPDVTTSEFCPTCTLDLSVPHSYCPIPASLIPCKPAPPYSRLTSPAAHEPDSLLPNHLAPLPPSCSPRWFQCHSPFIPQLLPHSLSF